MSVKEEICAKVLGLVTVLAPRVRERILRLGLSEADLALLFELIAPLEDSEILTIITELEAFDCEE